jgi:hypothetical protein
MKIFKIISNYLKENFHELNQQVDLSTNLDMVDFNKTVGVHITQNFFTSPLIGVHHEDLK